MISDTRAEKALIYLASTDEECADLKAQMERQEFKARATKDALFLRVEGSVAERNAIAGSADEYKLAMDAYFDALRRYEAMRNKRTTEVIVMDTWRTIQANQRKGG